MVSRYKNKHTKCFNKHNKELNIAKEISIRSKYEILHSTLI